MAAQHCIESMPIIHSLKGIIERMKTLLKTAIKLIYSTVLGGYSAGINKVSHIWSL